MDDVNMLDSSLDALNLLGSDGVDDVKKQLKLEVKPLIYKRASVKRAITRILSKLTPDLEDTFIADQLKVINDKRAGISELDENVLQLYYLSPVAESLAAVIQDEEDKAVDYHYDLDLKLSQLKKPSDESSSHQGDDFVDKLSKALKHNTPKVHEIKLPLFHGDKSDVEYNDFITQFNNVIGSSKAYSPSSKLLYLKNQLRGEAYNVIKHLSNDDENFDIAIQFLNREFADLNVCIDRHLNRLFHTYCPQNDSVEGTKNYLNTIRAACYELKNFDFDPLLPDSFGDRALSYLLMEKLPKNFKSKLGIMLKAD